MIIDRLPRYHQFVQSHRANIQRSLARRLDVARSKGDNNLIQQLEAEQKYYN